MYLIFFNNGTKLLFAERGAARSGKRSTHKEREEKECTV